MPDIKLKIQLNGKSTTLAINPNLTLNQALNENGISSVKQGCETGDCGSCTVIVNGHAVQSCMMLAAQVEGKSVQTFESIEHFLKYQPLHDALLDNTEKDCGFCIPGIMMSLEALLKTNRTPDEAQIKDALNGNLCHCTANATNAKIILTAIKKIKGDF